MWSNWVDAGKSIAEGAKEAAEGIEAQLNESVGLNISNNNAIQVGRDYDDDASAEPSSFQEDTLNDAFYDEEIVLPTRDNATGGSVSDSSNVSSSLVESRPNVCSINGKPNQIDESKDGVFQFKNEGVLIEQMDEYDESGWKMEDDEILLSQDSDDDSGGDKNSLKEDTDAPNLESFDCERQELPSPSLTVKEKEENVDDTIALSNIDEDANANAVAFGLNSCEKQSGEEEQNKIESDSSNQENVSDSCFPSDSPRSEKESLNSTQEENGSYDQLSTGIQKRVDDQDQTIAKLRSQINTVKEALNNREEQLKANSVKFTTLQNLHENEKDSLLSMIKDTKEEAKIRMLKAKERFEEIQDRLKTPIRNWKD